MSVDSKLYEKMVSIHVYQTLQNVNTSDEYLNKTSENI